MSLFAYRVISELTTRGEDSPSVRLIVVAPDSLAKRNRLDRSAGVARIAHGDENIPLLDTYDLFIHFSNGGVMEQVHVITKQIEVIAHKAGQCRRRTHADYVHVLCTDDCIDSGIKADHIYFLNRLLELFHIGS